MRKKPSSRAAHDSDAVDHQKQTEIRRLPRYEIEAQAQREITEHLRGLRLARDAVDAPRLEHSGVETMRRRSLTEAGKGPRR